MKLVTYTIYAILLYLIYIVISHDYGIVEHIKKESITNTLSGRDKLNVGDWKFISAKGEECENSTYPLCDKLFIQDPYGTKFVFKEVESDILDKKY